MPLSVSQGNMYPWVTHTHSHLRGRCEHRCVYCYVQDIGARYQTTIYEGPVRLEPKEFNVNYGGGKTIFVEHMNDIFGPTVTNDMIIAILKHVLRFPDNKYVMQSKDPWRFQDFMHGWGMEMILGTTIETTDPVLARRLAPGAPAPFVRACGMVSLKRTMPWAKRFVTIEPIVELDGKELCRWLDQIEPDFVTIGADSKSHNLPEPTALTIADLITDIQARGIEIRAKHNLERLLA